MKEAQLEFPGLDTGVPEVTEWFTCTPPMAGWWETNMQRDDGTWSPFVERRLWRGGPVLSGESRWSQPAKQRLTEERTLWVARTDTNFLPESRIRWRGLVQPAPAEQYPYIMPHDIIKLKRLQVVAARATQALTTHAPKVALTRIRVRALPIG